MKIDNDNYFDIAEAIHCYASLNHEGQTSDLYLVLSESQFNPGPLWSEEYCERENFYYGELLYMKENEVIEISKKLNEFINNKK